MDPIGIKVYDAINEHQAWQEAQFKVDVVGVLEPFELVLTHTTATRHGDEWRRVYHFEVQFT